MGDSQDEVFETEEQAGKDRGFLAILRIFARTWPFIKTYVAGYWQDVPFKNRQSKAASSQTNLDGSWGSSHIPPVVTVLVILGLLLGLIDLGTDWLQDFLGAGSVLLAIFAWGIIFTRGRLSAAISTAMIIVATICLLFAIFAVDGLGDNLFVGLVCIACSGIWVLQYRIQSGRVFFRIRVGSHLVYYFILVWASTFLTLLLALFSVDVISQSILQAKPLTPFIADLISKPEMAGASATLTDTAQATSNANIDLQPLSDDQRHQLKWVYATFLLIGWLINIPASMLLPYYYVYIMQRINQDLRIALVEQWHRLSLRYHSDHRVGDSVYRLYQDSAQVTAVIGEITQALQVLITYSTGILFLFALDPILGAMALIIVVFTVLWAKWFSPRMRSKSLASRRANSDFTSRVQETFASAKLIKAFGTERLEQERFERDSITAFNASYRVRSLVAVIGIVSFTITAGALLYGQFLTAIWAVGERETYATVLVGLVGLSFLKWNLSAYQSAQEHLGASSNAIRDLVDRWTKAQDMAMGLQRAFDILDIEPDIKNAPNAVPIAKSIRKIEYSNVQFSYEPGRPILNKISFSICSGSVTAIVGPTGSGKTTLMSMLSRLFDPDHGSVLIDDIDLRKYDLDSLRSNVSIALQENVLFGLTLRENIRYVVPDATDDQVLQAAKVACVDEYIDRLPAGLDTVLSDRGGKLSTGQRQRLSIARALVRGSPILILDEPTAALDAETEHRVLDRLSKWGENRVVFLITHRISTVKRADQIIYLDSGNLIEMGSHHELMKIEGGHYRRFVETEARLSKRLSRAQQPSGKAS